MIITGYLIGRCFWGLESDAGTECQNGNLLVMYDICIANCLKKPTKMR